MSQITFSIANAFSKLRAPDFEPVLTYLRAERQDAMELMTRLSDEQSWRQLQGKAKLIEELLTLVETSPELMAKLQRASR